MVNICKLFGGYQDLKEKFQQLRAHSYTTDAKIKGGQSSTQCKKTTILCSPYECGATSLVCKIYMSLSMLPRKKNHYLQLLHLLFYNCIFCQTILVILLKNHLNFLFSLSDHHYLFLQRFRILILIVQLILKYFIYFFLLTLCGSMFRSFITPTYYFVHLLNCIFYYSLNNIE